MLKRLLMLAIGAALALSFTACKKTGGNYKKVNCMTSGRTLKGKPGSVFKVDCPADCTSGSVWGTGIYTTDSKVCKAAIHAGVIGKGGGKVRVTFSPGRKSYVGSQQNGIKTGKWGRYGSSFSVSK